MSLWTAVVVDSHCCGQPSSWTAVVMDVDVVDPMVVVDRGGRGGGCSRGAGGGCCCHATRGLACRLQHLIPPPATARWRRLGQRDNDGATPIDHGIRVTFYHDRGMMPIDYDTTWRPSTTMTGRLDNGMTSTDNNNDRKTLTTTTTAATTATATTTRMAVGPVVTGSLQ
ncbi:hypothetical protein EDB89DRAFT_1913337 [Lactarius sanguifluus]|nr:hypothetical protein EDB89DRAFT_1913337 [Lactarius sanguifluus]